MTPEELAEARHYAACYQAGYVHDLMHNFLAHIDQQATLIKELDDAVSGPLENIAKMLETVNADMIFSGIIQTWKNENGTLKTRITALEAQVAALREIAIGERAGFLHYRASCYDPGRRCPYAKGCDDCTGWDTCSALDRFNADAIRQLSEKHPEAFR